MSHVFISYSTKNADYAQKLAAKLREEGFDVWVDNLRLRSSEDWWRSIVLALRGCAAVVVILTPESDASDWVQREITLAGKYKKPIFPLWLSGNLDTPNWEYFVRIQIEDVRGGKLPPSHVFDTIALHAPRQERRGMDVTKQTPSSLPEMNDRELARDIANRPTPIETLPTPLPPEAVEAIRQTSPDVLSPWLIPSDTDPSRPVSRSVLNDWMQKVKERAGVDVERLGFHAYKRAGVRTTEFGKFRDKLAEHVTGTSIETLREVYDDVTYEELAEAMEMLRKARRRA